MKTKNLLLALVLFVFAFSAFTEKGKNDQTAEFKVSGNCNMCKSTIESSLKGVDGIKSAVWNKDSKIMKVTYDPDKISVDQIHQKIADSGYETEEKKSSDKAYNSLHKCCQYKKTLHK